MKAVHCDTSIQARITSICFPPDLKSHNVLLHLLSHSSSSQYLKMLNFVANLKNPYFRNPEIFQGKKKP